MYLAPAHTCFVANVRHPQVGFSIILTLWLSMDFEHVERTTSNRYMESTEADMTTRYGRDVVIDVDPFVIVAVQQDTGSTVSSFEEDPEQVNGPKK